MNVITGNGTKGDYNRGSTQDRITVEPKECKVMKIRVHDEYVKLQMNMHLMISEFVKVEEFVYLGARIVSKAERGEKD